MDVKIVLSMKLSPAQSETCVTVYDVVCFGFHVLKPRVSVSRSTSKRWGHHLERRTSEDPFVPPLRKPPAPGEPRLVSSRAGVIGRSRWTTSSLRSGDLRRGTNEFARTFTARTWRNTDLGGGAGGLLNHPSSEPTAKPSRSGSRIRRK